jgi:FkbH-like protein
MNYSYTSANRLTDILATLDENPSQAAYLRAAQKLTDIDDTDLPTCRVAILGGYTTRPLVPCLTVEASRLGIAANIYDGDFGQVEQVLMQPDHEMHRHNPELIFILLDPATQFAALLSEGTDGDLSRISDWHEGLLRAIDVYTQSSSAHVVCSNLRVPRRTALGILEPETDAFVAKIEEGNRELRALATRNKHVHILDSTGVLGEVGLANAVDDRMFVLGRIPFTHLGYLALAKEMCRFLWAMKGGTKKCLVLDLDNTLWGGVIGEDGPEGILLGDEAIGLAFKQFQRVLKGLRETGILLAICSKNTDHVVVPVLDNHPEMILRPRDFSAVRINWNSKADNLRELAHELGLGLDSFVFVDDSPRERELVRQELPQVVVHDLPEDPALYAASLLNAPYFERLSLTAEDLQRAEMYEAQRKRDEAQADTATFEDYLRSLGMHVTIGPVTEVDFARVHQLTGKTNQFNLTTIRYTEPELREKVSGPDSEVYCLRVSDRFGDNGLTGVAVLTFMGDQCEVESLLLSCRVLGRTVETAFLAFLSKRAAERGAAKLIGRFRPTARNMPAEKLYDTHGFTLTNADPADQLWEYNIRSTGPISDPDWIHVSTTTLADNHE